MIRQEVYNKIPKAVFAAIAVSFLYNHQIVEEERISDELLKEWEALHSNGIVQQKPPNRKNNED